MSRDLVSGAPAFAVSYAAKAMTDPLSVFNGIHATTGCALHPAQTVGALVELAERERGSPMRTGPFALASLAPPSARKRFPALLGDYDLADPAEAGWGAIFSVKADPKVRAALAPLLEHRKEQVARYDDRRYHEFSRERGYQQGETKARFLQRQCVGPGEFDPVRVPYYLLLVGDPEEISFSFQDKLDGRYAVGRLCFDRLEDYARYADQVVATEKAAKPHRLRATVFGVSNADDRAMELTCEYLAKRVATNLAAAAKSWAIEKVLGVAATKDRLRRLLGGDQTPDLLFTTCHGMGFDAGDPRQEAEQGGLVCADWPGPLAWQRQLDEKHYFTARDVGDDARVGGLISFHFACHSAGTPAYDSFPERANGKPRCLARKPIVSGLGKRVLSHPAGGALAVVGHVERTWGYSFLWKGVGPTTQAFEQALGSLLAGQPVGFAMEPFARRASDLADDLHSAGWDPRGSREQAQEVASLWTALQDARNYVILGDPAVRLPAPGGHLLPPSGPSPMARRKMKFGELLEDVAQRPPIRE